MAREPLTTNEREQLVTAMVTNCSSFGEDDREWLEGLDDDRLTALAENCAENKVLNERMAELEAEVATLNKKGAKNKGMPPWLKKKVEADAEDEEDGEDDMEENSGCSGKKKMAKNERADDDDEPEDDDDEQMTDDEWLERAPASVRNAAQRYQAWEDQVKAGLVKTITANTRFTDEFLLQKPLEELEILAEPFQKKGRQQAAPSFAGMGAPTVRMTANAEPDMEEPLGVPEPDYAAFSGIAG